MLEPEILKRLTKLVVDVASPTRVYLFGSQASGQEKDDSDLDVFVVVPDDVADPRALSSAIRIAISEVVSMPCDVLVEREADFLARSELPTIERTILETGVVVYEKL